MRRSLALLAVVALPAQAQLAPGEGFVDVPGGKAWYRIVGSGAATPLLVVHGGPGSSGCYLSGLAALASDRPVVFYDQLGSGRSERPGNAALWNLERFTDELAAVRAALGLHRVHLLGHSWGSALASHYLLTRQPQGVASVTFASPLLSTPRWVADANRLRATLPGYVQRSLARHEQAGTLESDEYRTATQVFYDRFVYRHQPRADIADCNGSFPGLDVYRTMWGPTEFSATGNLRDFDVTMRLGEIRVPTLFLGGRHDEATPEALADFRARVPGAQLTVFEDSAHLAMQDEPAAFMAAVRSFLRGVEGDPEPPFRKAR